jgi:hypothetical protein
MKTAAEYRAMADECFKWAARSAAATKLDGLSQTGTKSAPDQPSKTARSGD